jgi:hypothetical protein
MGRRDQNEADTRARLLAAGERTLLDAALFRHGLTPEIG